MTSAQSWSRRHHWLEPRSSLPIFKGLFLVIYKKISIYFFYTAERMLRTIIMQNSKLIQVCFPIKIEEVWIDRFCVRYDWWRHQCPQCKTSYCPQTTFWVYNIYAIHNKDILILYILSIFSYHLSHKWQMVFIWKRSHLYMILFERSIFLCILDFFGNDKHSLYGQDTFHDDVMMWKYWHIPGPLWVASTSSSYQRIPGTKGQSFDGFCFCRPQQVVGKKSLSQPWFEMTWHSLCHCNTICAIDILIHMFYASDTCNMFSLYTTYFFEWNKFGHKPKHFLIYSNMFMCNPPKNKWYMGKYGYMVEHFNHN